MNRKDRHHGRNRGESRGGRRHGGIKVSVAGSGLRAGYVRDTGPTIKKKDKPPRKDKVQDKPDDARKPKLESSSDDVKVKEVVKEPAKELTSGRIENKKTSDLSKEVVNKTDSTEKPVERKIEEKEVQKPVQKEQKKSADKYVDKQEQKETQSKQGELQRNKQQQLKSNSTGRKSGVRPGKDMRTIEKDKKSKEKYEAKSDDFKSTGKKGQSKGYTGTKPGKPEMPKPKSLEIPKLDAKIEPEESRKIDYKNKDFDKDSKREHKREVQKPQAIDIKKKKIKTHEILIDGKKSASQLNMDDVVLDDLYEKPKSKKPMRAAKRKGKEKERDTKTESRASIIAQKSMLVSISIPEKITVKELSESLKKTSADVIKKLMSMGLMVTVNEEIDFDTAAIVTDEFGVKAEKAVVIN